jgi:hypothetical protein
VRLPEDGGGVDLRALLAHLGGRGVTSVLVEGGGILLGNLFDAGLVDKVMAFVAPVVIGGRLAPGPVGGRGAPAMAEALRLGRVRVREVGGDVMMVGYVPDKATRRQGDKATRRRSEGESRGGGEGEQGEVGLVRQDERVGTARHESGAVGTGG